MQSEAMRIALAMVGAYLLGSLPSAAWISRSFYNVDITQVGSRNPGMTNVLRTLGWKPALPVALLDAGKGLLSAWLGTSLTGNLAWGLAAGVAAVIGHSFTCFASFKGGKGVLTGFGVFVFFAPWSALAGLVTFALVVGLTRFVSLGSILAALIMPLAMSLEIAWGGRDNLIPVLYVAVVVCGFVIFRHRSNMVRLVNGTESRIGGSSGRTSSSQEA